MLSVNIRMAYAVSQLGKEVILADGSSPPDTNQTGAAKFHQTVQTSCQPVSQGLLQLINPTADLKKNFENCPAHGEPW